MIDFGSIKNILNLLSYLNKIRLKINYSLALKCPFFWATNIFNSIVFVFCGYVVLLILFFMFPIFVQINILLLMLLFLSPFFLLIYLNNSFINKNKDEVLVLKNSIRKLIFNNFLYITCSLILFNIAINVLEYRISISYTKENQNVIEAYDTKRLTLINNYEYILEKNENLDEKIKISKIIEKLQNKEFIKNHPIDVKKYESDLKDLLIPYYFLLDEKDNSLNITEQIIDERVKNINFVINFVDTLKSIFTIDIFYLIVFVIFLISIISNISHVSLGVFIILLGVVLAGIGPSIIFDDITLSFFLILVLYMMTKVFNIKAVWVELTSYITIILIFGIYVFIYYHFKLSEQFDLKIIYLFDSLVICLMSLITFLYYKFLFKRRLLSPKSF